MNIYYRLSDKGRPKDKPPFINNKACLENALKVFSKCNFLIVADNVDDSTYEWLKSLRASNILIERTQLGNSRSFWYIFLKALELNDDEIVYFLENDYVHDYNSDEILREGIQIGNYVTLYDHPDKYMNNADNKHVKDGGEVSRVYISNSCHWKDTNSTTMTFAAKVKDLKADKLIFKAFTNGIIPDWFPNWIPYISNLKNKNTPWDYIIFRLLIKFKSKKLISPIPSYSTHGEVRFLAKFKNWSEII